MPIYKGQFVGQGFTMVPNEAWKLLTNDGYLLLAYLLGKPETWDVRKENVRQDLGWGQNKIDQYFAELANVGYLKFEQIRNEKGQIECTVVHVTNIVGQFSNDESKIPDQTRTMETRTMENHRHGFETHSNKEVSNKDLSNTLMCVFDEIWQGYPRKLNKAGALKAFTVAVKRGADLDEIRLAVGNYAKAVAGRELQYIMHGSTFFGPNDRWRDFLNLEPEKQGSATVEEYERVMAEALAECEREDAEAAKRRSEGTE